jgi:hypothetical protein
MQKDQIVEEIRNIREAHAAKFNYDLKAICADMKKKEQECGHPVVSLPAKRRFKATGS